ncbi:MAG TPA: hypothetical protein PLV25_06720, partial [Opitutales bacterium]|nr:hypothetical protein [Opitutales bacterium]
FYTKTPIAQRYAPAFHFPKIWNGLILAGAALALVLAYKLLSSGVFISGVVLGLICLVYLIAANRTPPIIKQLYASVLFTAGIALCLFEQPLSFQKMPWYLGSLYLMILLHLLSSTRWDIEADEARRNIKFSALYRTITSIAPQTSLWVGLIIALLGLFGAIHLCWAISIGVTLISLALIDKSNVLSSHETKRLCADSIFALSPWLFLLLH